jgi:hypothetical protein
MFLQKTANSQLSMPSAAASKEVKVLHDKPFRPQRLWHKWGKLQTDQHRQLV